ncbi:hypothetical protein M0802_012430 [Mischocyttarus mexicanus]|nr:hypothetical protein M0802_012430 [Mischocyttarus mexicanus]
MARLEPFPNRNIFVKNNSRKKTELGRSREVGPIGQPYATSTFSLCLEGKLPGQIPVKTEIRQGDSLGPFLFTLVMDKKIKRPVKLNVLNLRELSTPCRVEYT